MEANLNGAHVAEANFDMANLYKADLRNAIGLSIDQLSNVKTLYLAKFDDELYIIIRQTARLVTFSCQYYRS